MTFKTNEIPYRRKQTEYILCLFLNFAVSTIRNSSASPLAAAIRIIRELVLFKGSQISCLYGTFTTLTEQSYFMQRKITFDLLVSAKLEKQSLLIPCFQQWPKDGAESVLVHKNSYISSKILLHKTLKRNYWKELYITSLHTLDSRNQHCLIGMEVL